MLTGPDKRAQPLPRSRSSVHQTSHTLNALAFRGRKMHREKYSNAPQRKPTVLLRFSAHERRRADKPRDADIDERIETRGGSGGDGGVCAIRKGRPSTSCCPDDVLLIIPFNDPNPSHLFPIPVICKPCLPRSPGRHAHQSFYRSVCHRGNGSHFHGGDIILD